MTMIFAIIKAIPILDKWAERSLEKYKEYKKNEDKRKLKEAIKKAIDEGNTEELSRIFGDKL